ncbi:PLC-like phosphodiesterase [Annulohypoxylon maeteangense]|uniref:PLC-like phosphodiesterase n=1 Tax=Annulohypoxylon maeteangense TaxID=1927788 RepID=UPI0020078E5E|nr:PLC-like phosphodiesterase [Annulohypoxylon maeteangense]KAI0887536.1 PLC-like phosphodiesterase [Annulohypoxylon maeteangense]
MIPSLCTFFTTVAALTATAHALPQQGSGFGSSSSTSSSFAVASSSSTASASASSSTSTTACNNSPSLCSRSYSNVTHMGAHDSAFLRDASTSNSVAGNQYYNATVALDAGIRLLQAQVHDKSGVIQLCHTSCNLLDAGTLQSWLTSIKSWMDSNPNEVVTLLLVNSDSKTADQFGTVFSASGISTYGYEHSGSTWPTLQEMITSNKRLVTFIASITTSTTYPYLLSEFDHIFETAYDVTSLSGFNCTLDRPSTQSSASAAITAGMMPLMNHFAYQLLAASIEIPDVDSIATTNSPSTSTTGNLGLHAQNCNSEWTKAPTFVLVDFFNEGPAITTADNLNGISAVGRSTKAMTSTTVTTAAAGRTGGLGMGAGALVAFLVATLVLV